MDLTKITQQKLRLELQTVDANVLLQNTLQMLAKNIADKQIKITVIHNCDNHKVFADSARLQQIFWNLIGNFLIKLTCY